MYEGHMCVDSGVTCTRDRCALTYGVSTFTLHLSISPNLIFLGVPPDTHARALCPLNSILCELSETWWGRRGLTAEAPR